MVGGGEGGTSICLGVAEGNGRACSTPRSSGSVGDGTCGARAVKVAAMLSPYPVTCTPTVELTAS